MQSPDIRRTACTRKTLPQPKPDIHALEERLSERMRDMQTKLLKAFLPYQEQTRLRDSALEAR
jgi:hypothetical protein